MMRIALCILVTVVITFIVPLPAYAACAWAFGLEPPGDGPAGTFMVGVLIQKVGTAIGFVLLLCVARSALRGRWALYALLWWIMAAIVEVGDVLVRGEVWASALAGIVAEAVYFPLCAFIVDRLLPGR